LANILFWLFFAHHQNLWICNGIFFIFKLLFGFISMQPLHSMKDITLASHVFVPTLHHNWMI